MSLTTVSYSGVPGSYAEEAAINYFQSEAVLLTASSFASACEAVQQGDAEFAVLPIENSSTGAISAVYDLLAEYQFSIVGETVVTVNQCLMAKPETSLSDIQEVFSHEQGIAQSKEFLGKYPHWKCVPVYNTAAAAKMVAESVGSPVAAIASKRAAELYGLTILVEKTNFKERNQTRFVVVSKTAHPSLDNNKVSLSFTLRHQSGTLYQMLEIFAREKLNLLKIESRPMPNRNWEYLFFLDFSAEGVDRLVDGILKQAAEFAGSLTLLGCYKGFSEKEVGQ